MIDQKEKQMTCCAEHMRHPTCWDYVCTDAYKDPKDGEWLECPKCGLKPRVWLFDNGRSTACGCGVNKYDHWSICAESICSVFSRTNGTVEYHSDELRKYWNHYCRTGEVLFETKGGREDERW